MRNTKVGRRRCRGKSDTQQETGVGREKKIKGGQGGLKIKIKWRPHARTALT